MVDFKTNNENNLNNESENEKTIEVNDVEIIENEDINNENGAAAYQDNDSVQNTYNVNSSTSSTSSTNATDSSATNANGAKEYTNEDFLKSAYYNENFNRPAKKKSSNIMQMVLVSVISSVFGGVLVAMLIYFATPFSQNMVKYVPGIAQLSNNLQSTASDSYKKVEIVGDENDRVTAIAEKTGPSIVGIRVTPKQSQDTGFFFSVGPATPSEGSGIVVSSDGYILTNNHVVESVIDPKTPTKVSSGSKIEVFLPSQVEKPYTAVVVGYDWKTDLAVLKIEGTNFPAAELGNSDEIKVGELAVAIGNPGGMEFMGSITAGVISGLNRSVEVQDGTASKILKVIQTDAAINPGNSGGALVNSKGQVIGVNTVKLQATGYEGLGFAIPINTVKDVYNSLVDNGYVTGRPWIGIGIDPDFTEAIANKYKVPAGVLVSSVEPLSGANTAGILKGDIITKFDGKAVKLQSDLEAIKDEHKVGDVIEVEVFRMSNNSSKGETITLKLSLTEYKG